MHFVEWQKKFRVLMLTNLDKKTYKYVIAKMFQDVNGASCGPNANNFKHPEVLEIGVPFCSSLTYIEILKRIHWTMRFIPHISTQKKIWYGITYIAHIKDNVRMFLQCGLLVANRSEELAPVYMEKFKKSLHIPQVILQLKMKIRAITFGTTQIAELCKLVVNQIPLEKCSFLLDVTEILYKIKK